MQRPPGGNNSTGLAAPAFSPMKHMASLRSDIHALPAEIYNEILELTFTSLADDYFVYPDYKPHSCLQVSRDTRSKAIRSYYEKSTFYVREDLVRKWITSLPLVWENEQLQVRICGKSGPFLIGGQNAIGPSYTCLKEIYATIPIHLILNREGVKIEVMFEPDGERHWKSLAEIFCTLFGEGTVYPL